MATSSVRYELHREPCSRKQFFLCLLNIVYRHMTECGEGPVNQTTGAFVLARTPTGTGDSTGMPPTAQALIPVPGTL